jgi:hypothetical protein
MDKDLSEHWISDFEISQMWNTQEAFEKTIKFHSVSTLTKYNGSRSLLCVPDIDDWRMKDLFQRIFSSSDPDNVTVTLNELVYDCLYIR